MWRSKEHINILSRFSTGASAAENILLNGKEYRLFHASRFRAGWTIAQTYPCPVKKRTKSKTFFIHDDWKNNSDDPRFGEADHPWDSQKKIYWVERELDLSRKDVLSIAAAYQCTYCSSHQDSLELFKGSFVHRHSNGFADYCYADSIHQRLRKETSRPNKKKNRQRRENNLRDAAKLCCRLCNEGAPIKKEWGFMHDYDGRPIQCSAVKIQRLIQFEKDGIE